tara:strand:- start:5 stop:343 length:339 start_codon:yes stop_codon:yes gene_type:complete
MEVNKLPPIPEKKYFSISEVASLCELKAHTLRFWEKEFSQLKPTTRRGSRRVYQKEDILLVRKIKNLLYEDGLTIRGVKKNLSNKKDLSESSHKEETIQDLEKILKEIKEVF